MRALRNGLHGLLLAGALLLAAGAWAAGFEVLKAGARLEAGVVRLDAQIAYELSEAALDALKNGVPLTVEIDIEVQRRREWVWDETVASLTQRWRLEYHPLARQYAVVNLNTGELKGFPTLTAALDAMGRLRDFPVLDASLLAPDDRYQGRLRATLDIEALPSPLRPLAYLSGEWRLASPWFTWPL